MRARAKIIESLESVYRQAYEQAEKSGNADRMAELDFGFQRDQIVLEALLDVRDALGRLPAPESAPEPSLLDKAMAIRRFAKPGLR